MSKCPQKNVSSDPLPGGWECGREGTTQTGKRQRNSPAAGGVARLANPFKAGPFLTGTRAFHAVEAFEANGYRATNSSQMLTLGRPQRGLTPRVEASASEGKIGGRNELYLMGARLY